MRIHELVVEMKLLERRMTLFEEKYGVLSADFHAALMSGQLARYDERVNNAIPFQSHQQLREAPNMEKGPVVDFRITSGRCSACG